jgi:ECF sigma factor
MRTPLPGVKTSDNPACIHYPAPAGNNMRAFLPGRTFCWEGRQTLRVCRREAPRSKREQVTRLGESCTLSRMTDVTRILSAIEQGDPQAAEQLLPLVYDELRRLAAAQMAREQPGQTLAATALVHEAYLRLVGTPVADAPGSPGGSATRGRRTAFSSPLR